MVPPPAVRGCLHTHGPALEGGTETGPCLALPSMALPWDARASRPPPARPRQAHHTQAGRVAVTYVSRGSHMHELS